jgi:hypothetical protein
MITLHFNIFVVVIGSFIPFVFASIMTNFHKWKYYKKVYEDLPNKKFIIWESADGNSFSSDEPYEKRFFSLKGKSYQLTERIYLNRDIMTYFDPYSLYWLLKFDRYFKYNPVLKPQEKRNQRVDQLLK